MPHEESHFAPHSLNFNSLLFQSMSTPFIQIHHGDLQVHSNSEDRHEEGAAEGLRVDNNTRAVTGAADDLSTQVPDLALVKLKTISDTPLAVGSAPSTPPILFSSAAPIPTGFSSAAGALLFTVGSAEQRPFSTPRQVDVPLFHTGSTTPAAMDPSALPVPTAPTKCARPDKTLTLLYETPPGVRLFSDDDNSNHGTRRHLFAEGGKRPRSPVADPPNPAACVAEASVSTPSCMAPPNVVFPIPPPGYVVGGRPVGEDTCFLLTHCPTPPATKD